MNAMTIIQPTNAEVYRASTDAAGLCREIVLKTAMEIQDRKYVKVEGWQAIAIAHGCTGSARDVERVEGGVRAVGEIRRMSDGAIIATAEGFVGEDEATWFGGTVKAWRWGEKRGEKVWYDKDLPKRPDYAIRAMAQTRAISRACRSAFAHVVVLIDANLSTTPAEEVPHGGFENDEPQAPRNVTPAKPKAEPEVTAKTAKDAQPTTLEGWADKLETALLAARGDTAKVKHTFESAAKLCADLDDKMPERLAEITATYTRLMDEQTPALAIADDEIPY